MDSIKLCIVGHFASNKEFYDGQTVKTRNIYYALKRRGIGEVKIIDTYLIKHNPIRFIFDFIKNVSTNKKFIILLSGNGRRYLFPLFSFLSNCFCKEIYHFAIGGRLAREVNNDINRKKYVQSFKANWVESKKLERDLKKLGVENACYIPNFKDLVPLKEAELKISQGETYRFCTFSRVLKEKGISDAICAIDKVNNYYGRKIAELDIYGPIDSKYKDEFNELIAKSRFSNYCGIIDSNDSVSTLRNYYFLLFPTHWKHEGIPGTIIDSFFSGVPVIARNWEYCSEMITDNVTGYIYEFDKPEELFNKIIFSIENAEKTYDMRKNCLKKAKEYSEEVVIEKISSQLVD